jgi:hypothetical protein
MWLPLGLVIFGSSVLPRILGYLALVLAAVFALAGIATLLDLTVPPAVQVFGSVQAVWWLAAAGTLIIRAREPSTAGLPGGAAVTGTERPDACDQCSVAPHCRVAESCGCGVDEGKQIIQFWSLRPWMNIADALWRDVIASPGQPPPGQKINDHAR